MASLSGGCKPRITVVTRMDTLTSGWTPYVYFTTLYSSQRTIYANLLGRFLRKVGKSVVREKEVNTGFSTEGQ